MKYDMVSPWNHPDFQVSVRAALPATIAAMLAVAAGYLGAGSVTLKGFVEFSIFAVVVAGPVAVLFLYWIWVREAAIEQTGLRIRGRTSNNTFPWSSIAGAELTTFRDAERFTAAAGKLVGVTQSQRCVRVKLQTFPRWSPFRRRMSTDVTFGMPMPFKSIFLYPAIPMPSSKIARDTSPRRLRSEGG